MSIKNLWLARQKKVPPAFTLIELIAVLAILGILAALAVPTFGRFRARSELAVCANNMRNLHAALSLHLQEQGQWPQVPEGVRVSPAAFGEWWIATLEPYGAPPEIWLCPTIRREQRSLEYEDESQRPVIHYVPTPFDALPLTPFKWATQPWLLEISDAHGSGNLIIFPDGSIETMNDAMNRLTRPEDVEE